MDQLGDGGKNVHEIDKARKRAELEKEELQTALEEAEAALEQEEAKVIRLQMELCTIRQEIDRRIHDKDEEFEATRRNHARSLESMQASLEAELRSKTEALKQVKTKDFKSKIKFSLFFFRFRKRNLNPISMILKLHLIMLIVQMLIHKKH
jgi:citrate synthase